MQVRFFADSDLYWRIKTRIQMSINLDSPIGARPK